MSSFRYPRQDIFTLPLKPAMRQRLQEEGFHTLQDLDNMTAADLANELKISMDDALEILKVALYAAGKDHPLAGAKTAAQLFQEEKSREKIITFHKEMDDMLGGGAVTGTVTEFCGAPGLGKTQIGIQLAINVQIPRAFSGLESEALYIDTEGSFMVERAMDIAEGLINHLRMAASKSSNNVEKMAAVNRLSAAGMLSRIHYLRIYDWAQQLAVVASLDDYLRERQGRIKLIVVDSVAFHFRQDFTDMAHRSRLLASMAQDLMNAAESHKVAVVLMNQVTTKTGADGKTALVPALGDTWAHAATARVVLFWSRGIRYAHLYKSPSQPARTVAYDIHQDGFRKLRGTAQGHQRGAGAGTTAAQLGLGGQFHWQGEGGAGAAPGMKRPREGDQQ